ncbi:hypothetical protein D9M72_630600 [compost metagenome]
MEFHRRFAQAKSMGDELVRRTLRDHQQQARLAPGEPALFAERRVGQAGIAQAAHDLLRGRRRLQKVADAPVAGQLAQELALL